MIKVSSKTKEDGHSLCGSTIYSISEEHYKYDICNWHGFTRYYFDNILLKIKSGKTVILISKDLDNKSFVALYNCLYESQKIKVFHEEIQKILNT